MYPRLLALPARGEDALRIAMTASDIPTTTGMPNNGFEGMRFLGYPVFEALVLWDLSRADHLAALRPGLADWRLPGLRLGRRTGYAGR
jgi:peptide/nickel transport system substrate-binding protein